MADCEIYNHLYKILSCIIQHSSWKGTFKSCYRTMFMITLTMYGIWHVCAALQKCFCYDEKLKVWNNVSRVTASSNFPRVRQQFSICNYKSELNKISRKYILKDSLEIYVSSPLFELLALKKKSTVERYLLSLLLYSPSFSILPLRFRLSIRESRNEDCWDKVLILCKIKRCRLK